MDEQVLRYVSGYPEVSSPHVRHFRDTVPGRQSKLSVSPSATRARARARALALLQCRVAIYSRRITVTSADGKYKRKAAAARILAWRLASMCQARFTGTTYTVITRKLKSVNRVNASATS